MKIKELGEIRKKSAATVREDIKLLKQDILKTTLEYKSNTPKDTNTISKKKRKLAVLQTIVKELK
jgi:ribosomal protein L29